MIKFGAGQRVDYPWGSARGFFRGGATPLGGFGRGHQPAWRTADSLQKLEQIDRKIVFFCGG
jgi:hypothetical protein